MRDSLDLYFIDAFLNLWDWMRENAIGPENAVMALEEVQIAKLTFGLWHIL